MTTPIHLVGHGLEVRGRAICQQLGERDVLFLLEVKPHCLLKAAHGVDIVAC
ncbi:MAG: hypothetical protein M3083_03085 [Actinomycetota bacterium]|nr:hypothetical protein [Actinomycetota bacterium]